MTIAQGKLTRLFYHKSAPIFGLIAILLIRLFLGVAYVSGTPLFEYPTDETGHFGLVRFLATNHRLPGAADMANAVPVSQFTQPPLFHVLSVPFDWLLDDNKPIPGQANSLSLCQSYNQPYVNWLRPVDFSPADSGAVRTGYALRLFLLVMMLVAVGIIYLAALQLFPGRYDIALCSAALLAFLPYLVSSSVLINNDVPIYVLGAISLYVVGRYLRSKNATPRSHLIWLMLLGFLSILATLDKVTGWVLIAFSVCIVLYQTLRSPVIRRLGVVVLGLFVIGIVGILIFNLRQYNSIIGRYQLSGLSNPVTNLVATAGPTLLDTERSIVPLDDLNSIPVRGLRAVYIGSMIAVIGGAVLLLIRLIRPAGVALRRGVILCLLMLILSAILVLYRNISAAGNALTYAPVRYYGPAVPAFALLAAVALCSWPGISRFAAGLFVAAVWLIVCILLLSDSPMAIAQRDSAVSGLPSGAVVFDADQSAMPAQIAGYQILSGKDLTDGVLRVRLFIVANQTRPDRPYQLSLTLAGTDCVVPPVGGLMPLTQLQPGQMMADTVDLPYCGTTPTSGPTNITLSWRPISKDGRTIGSADSANIPTLKLLSLPASPGRKASGCFDNFGTIGGTFQIIKFTLDKQLSASAPFNPFVTWFAHDVVQEVYQREFQLLAADGTVISECLPPGNNYVPTNIWRMGEIYYFENCPLDTSAVHPGETYQVVVGMRDSQNHWLPTDKAGADRVVLGTYVAQP